MNNHNRSVRSEIEAAFDHLWLEALSASADTNDVRIAGKEEFISQLEKYLTVKEEKEI